MRTILIFLVILVFNSCIIIEEITNVNYVIRNDTDHSIELLNRSFDFLPNEYNDNGSGVIPPRDSLDLYYYMDGIVEKIYKTPFEYIDSLQVIYNNIDTTIHYIDNRNGLEDCIFDESNWIGGEVNRGRHHVNFIYRYIFSP